jgi:MFS family permease
VRAGLLRTNPAFRSLWAARAVSSLGDRFSLLAVPALALSSAAATPGQVALLWTVQMLPGAVLSVPVAAWLAGCRERRVMMVCDLLRAVVLGVLALLAAWDGLVLWHLFAGVVASGVLTTVFDVCAQSYGPRLTGRADYAEANTRFAQSASGADIAGPAVAGVLVAVSGAGTALLVDATSFLVSLALLARLREVAGAAPAHVDGRWARLRAGVRFVARQPGLRALVLAFASFNLGGAVFAALWFPYLVTTLGLSASVAGALITVGGVSALAAALASGRIARLGPRVLLPGALVAIVVALWLPGLAGGHPVPFLVAYQVVFGFAVVLFSVTAATVRQWLTPLDYQGRVYAVVYTCALGTVPVGGLLASMVASWTSTTTAVLAGAGIASVSLVTLRILTGTAVPATVTGTAADGQTDSTVSA